MSDQTLEFFEGFAMALLALVVAAVSVWALCSKGPEGQQEGWRHGGQAQRQEQAAEVDGHSEVPADGGDRRR